MWIRQVAKRTTANNRLLTGVGLRMRSTSGYCDRSANSSFRRLPALTLHRVGVPSRETLPLSHPTLSGSYVRDKVR